MGIAEKKQLICDYCQSDTGASQVYTPKKVFGGIKVVDILQKITKCSVPITAPIKLCCLCLSTLMSTTVVIEKTQKLLQKCLQERTASQSKAKTAAVSPKIVTEDENPIVSGDEAVKLPTNSDSPKAPANKQQKGNKATPTQKSSPTKATASTNKQSSKTPNDTEILSFTAKDFNQIDDLEDAVKLTPLKDFGKKTAKKTVLKLFGGPEPVNDTDTGNESESDEDENKAQPDTKKSQQPTNKSKGFQCKFCDFTDKGPKIMKTHLMDQHAQKRPRIYDCTMCSKSFGVLKSLKKHMATHSESSKPTEQQTEVASFKVLNESVLKKKLFENVQNTEYTFAINGSKTSTPNPVKPQKKFLEFQCDICDSELKTLKVMQEHMKNAHGITNPKLFKCDVCFNAFSKKQSLKFHQKEKHGLTEPQLPPKRKHVESDYSSVVETDEELQPPVPSMKLQKLAAELKSTLNKQSKAVEKVASSLSKRRKTLTNDETILTPLDSSPTKKSKTEDSSLKSPDEPTEINNQSLVLNGSDTLLAEEFVAAPTKGAKRKTKQDNAKLSIPSQPSGQAKPETSASPMKHVKPNQETADLEEANLNGSQSGKIISSRIRLDSRKKFPIPDEQTSVDPSPTTKIKTEDSSPKSPHEQTERNNQSPELNGSDTLLAEEFVSTPTKGAKRKTKEDNAKLSTPSQPSSQAKPDDEINCDVQPHKRVLLESDLEDTGLNCSQCGKTVTSRIRLDSHILKKHSNCLKCPICRTRWQTSTEYIDHFADTCDSSDGWPCGAKKCGKIFQDSNYLTSHLQKKHDWS